MSGGEGEGKRGEGGCEEKARGNTREKERGR